MIDHSDLVAKMRDIHHPQLGEDLYILLSAGAGIVCALLIAKAVFHYSKKRRSPISVALRALNAAETLPTNDKIIAYTHIIRELVYSFDRYAPSLTGQQWLVELDRTFKTDFFTSGDGRIFGDSLYRREDYILPVQLDNNLKSLIRELGDI